MALVDQIGAIGRSRLGTGKKLAWPEPETHGATHLDPVLSRHKPNDRVRCTSVDFGGVGTLQTAGVAGNFDGADNASWLAEVGTGDELGRGALPEDGDEFSERLICQLLAQGVVGFAADEIVAVKHGVDVERGTAAEDRQVAAVLAVGDGVPGEF